MSLYSLPEVADRIEAVLGSRPGRHAMYHAGEGLPVRAGSKSLVAGMPAAVNVDGARMWDVQGIEAWLSTHPILQLERARADLAHAYRAAQDWDSQKAAVETAKQHGCSWAQIAEVIGEVEQRRISRQAVAARYS